MKKQTIYFYLNRLKRASFPELIHRLREQRLLRRITKQCIQLTELNDILPADIHRYMDILDAPMLTYIGADNDTAPLSDNRLFTLNTPMETIVRFEEIWRKFPFPIVKADNSDPDIRAVWEPARLQNIALLLARNQNNYPNWPVIEEGVKRCLFDWLRNNPFPNGPHYISVMECGLRIPVFFYCLKRLGRLSKSEYITILKVIYEHAWLISNRLSLYSSLGNHTIAESVGLIFAGALFRKNKTGQQWLKQGLVLLEQELHHQVFDDGGPAEQSINYHRFILDLYWLSVDFLERNSLHDCSTWKPRLIRGEEFLGSFKLSGCLPTIGDSDDGYAIAPGVIPIRRSITATWETLKTFPTTGYSIVNTNSGCSLIFDHGPLGMAPLYNHGHADALSIVMYKNGHSILVDPGTYRYNGESRFRQYFKGTRAHNTITVDDTDQAIQDTGFIWSHPFNAELSHFQEQEGAVILEATHNGYTRLQQPVYHKRRVSLIKQDVFLIKDTFSGNGFHQFEINYHLHPEASVVRREEWLEINFGRVAVHIALLRGDTLRLVRGQNSPLLGWYSPAYGIKTESTALTCTKAGKPENISFLTVISTGPDRPDLLQLEVTPG